MILGICIGIPVGILISVAYNAWKPKKFDEITDKAERKVRDL